MRRAGNARHRTLRTTAQLRDLIKRFEPAGQTRGELRAANGLALNTLDLWQRKVRATPSAVEEDQPQTLLVEVTNPAQMQTAPTSRGTGAWEVELGLGGGVVLRLRRAAGW